jgi:folate-dependent phosphoribosylglycinamide formyltransferase PurN
MKIGLFAYNFPHKKTQDFISRLMFEGYAVDVILAADPVQLNIPHSAIKSKIRHQGIMHPATIAQRLGIPYHVVKHNSEQARAIVTGHGLDIGVIAGARILKPLVIDAFAKGVINYHPGLIPESRGLDALFWSIHNNIPLGVTSHLIDRNIDAGIVLERKLIPLYKDDTLFDLSERLYEVQLDMIDSSIRLAMAGNGYILEQESGYNKKMDEELELQMEGKLPAYLQSQLENAKERNRPDIAPR